MLHIDFNELQYFKIWGDILNTDLLKSVFSVIDKYSTQHYSTLSGVIVVEDPTIELVFALSEIITIVIE